MIEILNELADKAMKDEVYISPLFPPSPYYRFFKRLVEWHKPKVSIELGVCGGGGCLHMALPGIGKVYGIDIARDHEREVSYIENLSKNFTFILGDSVETAKDWNKGKIDLMFIDTDHRYDRTIKEFEAWKPHLSKRAIVCMDDIFRHHPDDQKSMNDAWDELKGQKHRIDYLHDGTYPYGGGFGIIWDIE